MLIRETTLRRIIREEAQRVLREAAAVPDVPGVAGQTPYAKWAGLSESMTALSQQVAQAGMNVLATKIKDLAVKGRDSSSAPAALVAAAVEPDGTAPPAARKELLDQLAATLATLATEKSSPSYLGAATSLMGGAPTTNTVDQTFTPVLRGIMTMLSRKGYGVASIRKNLADIAATAPPPSPAVAPAKPAGGAAYYTVVKGDSLAKIANKMYDPPVPVTGAGSALWAEIAKATGIDVNSILRIGQKLVLPGTLGNGIYKLKGT